jgi:outer membrane protein assembly factor BamB
VEVSRSPGRFGCTHLSDLSPAEKQRPFPMKVLLSVAFATLFSSLLFAGDWPNWRGPHFDGISTGQLPETLPDSLPVLWKADVGIGFSSFAVVGDRVLTMGNKEERDSVWCLNAQTGEVIWQHIYDCPLDPLYYEGGPGGTPTVHGGSVYTLSKKGHVFRLDLETGKVIWSRDLIADHGLKLPEWSFAGSAFVEGELVILNAGRRGIALSRETGETIWLPDTDTSGYATIVPFQAKKNETQHLLFSAKSISSINVADGSVHWDFPWKSSRDVNAADPVVIGNEIVVSSSGGTKRLRPMADGNPPEVIWEQHDLKWYFNPGVLIDNHLYSLHGTTHRPTQLICTDATTGKTVWAEEGFGSGGLVAAGSDIIVFDLGKLTIFPATPDGFRPVLQQTILEGKCWTAPVIANGQIYCRNAEGKIAAVKVISADS